MGLAVQLDHAAGDFGTRGAAALGVILLDGRSGRGEAGTTERGHDHAGVAGTAGAKSPEVTWESLEGLAPDVLVVMPCGFYLGDARAQAEAHRERIAALGASRVFAVDAASTFSRPGPRLVDGTELLAHLLHPDLLDPPGGIAFTALD